MINLTPKERATLQAAPGAIIFNTDVDCTCDSTGWPSSIACINHPYLKPGTVVEKPTLKTPLLSPKQDLRHNLIVYYLDPALCAFKAEEVHKLLQTELGEYLKGADIRQKYRQAMERLFRDYGHARTDFLGSKRKIPTIEGVPTSTPAAMFNSLEDNGMPYLYTGEGDYTLDFAPQGQQQSPRGDILVVGAENDAHNAGGDEDLECNKKYGDAFSAAWGF